jgi:hypothetical protein
LAVRVDEEGGAAVSVQCLYQSSPFFMPFSLQELVQETNTQQSTYQSTHSPCINYLNGPEGQQKLCCSIITNKVL